MKLNIHTVLLFVLCLFVNKIFSQVTVILRPNSSTGKDALIDSQYPTVNDGANADFAAWSWTRSATITNARSLIDFDLSSIPSCATITSARLNLYCNTSSSITQLNSGSNSFYIQKITSNWGENTVTWNNQPTTTTTNQVVLSQSTSTTQNYENIDVTSLINDIRLNPSNSFGLMIKLVTETTYRCIVMSSSDHSDITKRPQLVIEYTSLPITNNNISISQNTFCAGTLLPTIQGSSPSGGVGNYTYKWINSTTNSSTGYYNAGGISNTQNYTPNNLSVNAWFRRITYSCISIDTSSAIAITILPKVNTSFNINNNVQCLIGNNFTFTDSSSFSENDGYTRMWNLGTSSNDTTSNENASKSYSAFGTYSVKLLTICNNGCKDSITKIIVVNPNPVAGFTVNNNSQCLVGNNFSFIDTSISSGGNLQRFWNFGNNLTSTSINPNMTFIEPNNYFVKLVVTGNNGCKDSTTNSMSVHPKPNVGFSVNNYSQCFKGNSFIFSDTSLISDNGSYTSGWSFGDTSFSNTKISIKSYANISSYSVKLVVTSNNNCKDSLVKIVTTNPTTLATINANGSTSFCQGQNVTLVANSGSGLTYEWIKNGAKIVNANNSTFVATSVGQHSAIITNSFGCKDTSSSLSIVVNSIPNIGSINGGTNANANDTFSYFVTPQSGFSYTWFVGNGNIISGQGSNLLKVKWPSLGVGTLKVLVTNATLCLDSAMSNISILNTSTEDLIENNFVVFPNPTKSQLTITNSSSLAGKKYIVTNLIGQTVLVGKLNIDKAVVNTESLANGMYLLSIEGLDKQAIKIIKE